MSFNSPKNVYFGAVKIYSVGVWNSPVDYTFPVKVWLKFTPLEFETNEWRNKSNPKYVKIYSVGVWNSSKKTLKKSGCFLLKFTPLEFETKRVSKVGVRRFKLKFTPLEFETLRLLLISSSTWVKIYSVGVWNLWLWPWLWF